MTRTGAEFLALVLNSLLGCNSYKPGWLSARATSLQRPQSERFPPCEGQIWSQNWEWHKLRKRKQRVKYSWLLKHSAHREQKPSLAWEQQSTHRLRHLFVRGGCKALWGASTLIQFNKTHFISTSPLHRTLGTTYQLHHITSEWSTQTCTFKLIQRHPKYAAGPMERANALPSSLRLI